ncbi:Helicase ATP-binding domain-containing protein [Fusobacterium sp. oral taxon C10]
MSEQFLYQKLDNYKEGNILKNLPEIIEKGLAKNISLREYQKDAFQYFVTYFENNGLRKNKQLHSLFHMATGSGKTVIMAGLILYLFTKGYKNFIFFVNQTNVIEKTKENFLNELSTKYLFNENIEYLGEKIRIKMVDNFQNSLVNGNDINICFTTTQKLHIDLLDNKENSLTYADFEDNKIVFISDESHHLNANTKKLNKTEKNEKETWETSIINAFHSNKDSVLLEFTATVDLKDKNINEKYKDKIIFNYPLKNFRESLYTKEFQNISTDTNLWERTLIALILSEYRKYLFTDLKLNIKPVLMLKSSKINDSKNFYKEFLEKIKYLKNEELEKIFNETNIDILKKAFEYFIKKDKSFNLLVHSIKDSFSENNLILINGEEDLTRKTQLAINSLEDINNPIRVVFAVDMLNEGWDVLNLFDIVRLYDTRQGSGQAGKIGAYTIKEAQLIGRGARYCPFQINNEQEKYKRKYDNDLENEYRVLETMYFHSKNDSKYIFELKQALIELGLQDNEKIELEYKIKNSFKETDFYKNSKLYLNECIEKDRTKIFSIDEHIKNKKFSYRINTLKGRELNLFNKNNENFYFQVKEDTLDSITKKLSDIEYHILLGTSECFSEFKFNILKEKFPNLKSTREFLTSPNYLGNIEIEFKFQNSLSTLKGMDYFNALKIVFDNISKYITSINPEYIGTKEFIPKKMNEIIKDKKIYLSKEIKNGGRGESQIFSTNTNLQLDLEKEDWYVFNDNYGTSEEKAFIKYFKTDIIPKLNEKNLEYYVIRNEREFAIYSFSDGSRFEPDYLLFVRKKKIDKDVIDYQIFVEPKGKQLLEIDEWKEKFLITIEKEAKLKKDKSGNKELIENKNYFILGLPFFNKNFRKKEFDEAINKFLKEI